jgi:hypothetical protein
VVLSGSFEFLIDRCMPDREWCNPQTRLGQTPHAAQFALATRALAAWTTGLAAIRAERADRAAYLAADTHWRVGRLAEVWRCWSQVTAEARAEAAARRQFEALVACWRYIASSKAQDPGRILARKVLIHNLYILLSDLTASTQ